MNTSAFKLKRPYLSTSHLICPVVASIVTSLTHPSMHYFGLCYATALTLTGLWQTGVGQPQTQFGIPTWILGTSLLPLFFSQLSAQLSPLPALGAGLSALLIVIGVGLLRR